MSPKSFSSGPSLFDNNLPEPNPNSGPAQWIVANVDGGARGNPGPAGYGVYIRDCEGAPVAQLSEYLGHKTNNFAEYSALIAALEYAIANGHRAVRAVSDSELMVRQIQGRYKVSSPDLKPLYEKAKSLIRQLEKFDIEHVLRGKNQHA